MTLSLADPLLLLAALLGAALARRSPAFAPTARNLAALACLSAARIVSDGAMAHPAQGLRHGLDRVAWAVTWGAHWTWLALYACAVVAALWRRFPALSPWAWPGVLAVVSCGLWRDYGAIRGAPIERASVALFRAAAVVTVGAAVAWTWRRARLIHRWPDGSLRPKRPPLTPAERVGLLLVMSTCADLAGPWALAQPVRDWWLAAWVNGPTWAAVCGVLALELWRTRKERT